MVSIQPQSTLSRLLATQTQLARLERQVGDARQELASGRHADVGLTLGSRATDALSLRQRLEQIAATTETNNLAATRLEATQVGLTSISDTASAFLEALVAARGSVTTAGILQTEAKDGLGRVIETLGAQVAGMSIFAGVAVDQRPLAQYFATPPPGSKSAVDSAFNAHFGISQSDPAVAAIPASLMQTYVDSVHDSLFADPAWGAVWSSSSTDPMQSRISADLVIDSSVTANEPGIRKIVQAFALVADSGVDALNASTFQVVVDKAIALVGEGMAEISELQGRVGAMQSRVSDANDQLGVGRIQATRVLSELEDVDAAELAVRLDGILEQMEAAYAVTARLQRLSLLDEI